MDEWKYCYSFSLFFHLCMLFFVHFNDTKLDLMFRLFIKTRQTFKRKNRGMMHWHKFLVGCVAFIGPYIEHQTKGGAFSIHHDLQIKLAISISTIIISKHRFSNPTVDRRNIFYFIETYDLFFCRCIYWVFGVA